MSLSKTYGVKSNAARAAAKFGLARNDLVAVEGGWAFEMPASAAAVPASEPAASAPADAAPTPQAPKRRTLAEAAANLRKAKAEAKTEHKANGKTKAAPKRAAGPKSGKTAGVIAQLKARWTSADAIMKETGWCSNTFRGVLGLHKLKTGEAFERRKVDGETQYRIVA